MRAGRRENRSRTGPAAPKRRPGRFPLAGGVLRACGAITSCLAATPQLPGLSWLHTRDPAGPDPKNAPGRSSGRAGAARNQRRSTSSSVLTDLHGVTSRDITGSHLHRRGAQPQGAGPARPRRGPPQDSASWRRPWTGRGSSSPPITAPCWPRRWRGSTGCRPTSTTCRRPPSRRLACRTRNSGSRPSPCPGRQRRAAQDAVAETGADTARFRTGPHLPLPGAWPRPRKTTQSGKRKGRAKAKKGNRYPGAPSHGEHRGGGGPHPDPRSVPRHRRLARETRRGQGMRR